MSTRRRAREVVLQLLYELDINNNRTPELSRQFIRSRMHGRKGLVEFALEMLNGTVQHRAEIDRQVGQVAINWTVSRMAVIDRNILRLGAFEILFADTPGRVAVNEAIVLAKRYGDKNSQRFVNGILDRLLKQHEQASV